MTQRLDYNVSGQVLRHTPETRRTSATWVLYDDRRSSGDSAKTLQSGNATLDAASQATTAAAGPSQANPRSIAIGATAAFSVGTRYQIVHVTTGEGEQFEVSGITSNAALIAEHPLLSSYPTGSTVRGVEFVTAAIDDAIVQNAARMQSDEPLRVVWTFGSGSPRHHQEQVRLVRWSHGDADLSRARQDILDIFPDAATRMAYQDRDTIDAHLRIVERQLRAMMLDRKIHAEEWLTGEQGHMALVWRALWHFARLGNAPGGDERNDPREWASYCKAEFERFWGALTSGEGGAEVAKVEPVNDSVGSTRDETYRRVFGEL